MYFHNPKFAILDECTSAVSIDVEKELYKASFERGRKKERKKELMFCLGITCITLSQRLALQEFHKQELKLG